MATAETLLLGLLERIGLEPDAPIFVEDVIDLA
jgi:hypothetical protein